MLTHTFNLYKNKFVATTIAILFVVFLLFGSQLASAQVSNTSGGPSTNVTVLQAMINSLMTQIALLQEQLNIISRGSESRDITIVSPNGGEKWEIGVTNTVTWTPYSYNPDANPARDVTAYLEVKNENGTFKTLGKVQESGKASIHWPTGEINSLTASGNYAQAGSGYYIRVVNNKTGATDRSDQPFTLLPKPVDLKVNGSDGPVKVALNEKVVLSWNAKSMSSCLIDNAYKDTSRKTQIGKVSLVGKMDAYLHTNPLWGPTLYCTQKNGNYINDSVKRTASDVVSNSTLKVQSPNGGEKLDPTKGLPVIFDANGISTFSIALYKNDMWKAWITKDHPNIIDPNEGIEFKPNMFIAGLGEGDNAGDIFKIYITGKKSDGSGYIDDKSDKAFSFIADPSTSTPRFDGLNHPAGTLNATVSAVFAAPMLGNYRPAGPISLGYINWGDAKEDERVSALANKPQITVKLKHTYAKPGTYIIKLSEWDGKSVSRKVVVTRATYTLADVQSVTKSFVDPIPSAIDDEYTLYIIYLKSGNKYRVEASGMELSSIVTAKFRATGYTGDVNKLMAMATATVVKPTPRFNGFTYPVGTPNAAASVVFSFEQTEDSCGTDIMGNINWGETGVGVQTIDKIVGSTCKAGDQTFNVKHTYSQPGDYIVTLTDLNDKTATKKVTATFSDPAVTAPGKNYFACGRAVSTKVADNHIACYGMWDYGNDFGGDVRMCGDYGAGKTGCVINTPVCASGAAKATAYIDNSSLTTTLLSTISSRLRVTPEVAKAGIAGLWEYKCTETPTPIPPISNSQLHVVGVYQASNQHNFCGSDWGNVTVNIDKNLNGKTIELALSSYEPVIWNIVNPNNVKINEILITGYNAQVVKGQTTGAKILNSSYYRVGQYTQGGDDGQGSFYDGTKVWPSHIYDWASKCANSASVPTQNRRYLKANPDYAFGYDSSDNTKLIDFATKKTGLDVTSFQGAYNGTSFTIGSGLVLGASTDITDEIGNTLSRISLLLKDLTK